jgi:hypothetical protein
MLLRNTLRSEITGGKAAAEDGDGRGYLVAAKNRPCRRMESRPGLERMDHRTAASLLGRCPQPYRLLGDILRRSESPFVGTFSHSVNT